MAKNLLLKWPSIFILFKSVLGSIGDNSQFFINCVTKCNIEICESGKDSTFYPNALGFGVSLWSCLENCEYKCQWDTVEAFRNRNWPIPQFRGKWPFIRLFGFQEPASVFFSILNFFVVLKLLRLFRKEVSKTTQFYNIWNIFGLILLNSWVWSSVYHARDTEITERLDYMSAFLSILYSFYAVGLRYMGTSLNTKTLFWSLICGLIGCNHLAYLWLYNFDYGYNMTLTCSLGGLTVIGWFIWTALHYQTQFYAWKIFTFALLVSLTTLLELMDFPPLLWLLDAHALWHGTTVIVNYFFFQFAIDDCKHLSQVALKEK